jgi:hypothetical protein
MKLPHQNQFLRKAVHLLMDRGPIGLNIAPVTLLYACTGKKPLLQDNIGHVLRQGPAHNPEASNRRSVSRTVAGTTSDRRRISRVDTPAFFSLIISRIRRITTLSIGIDVPPSQSRKKET